METFDFFPVFFSRSFGNTAQPGVRLHVEHMAWEAQGGCKSARLAAKTTGLPDLDLFSALLRCPVILYSAAGRRVWWGLVWSVQIQDGEGGTGVQLSLDNLTNRARVVYGRQDPETTGAGLRQTTTWADDLPSQAIYGVKEGQYSLELANPAQAETYRDNSLAAHSRITPRPTLPFTAQPPGTPGGKPGAGELTITVELRGWWETLAWRFYAHTTGGIEHITRSPNYLIPVGTSSAQIVAQQITVPSGGWQVEAIWFQLKRMGNPASTLSAGLYSDASGSPGAILASGTLDGTSLSISNPAWRRFALSAPVPVNLGTYWIAITDDGSKSDANYYRVQADRLAGYGGGPAKQWNGAAWEGIAPDLQFKVAGSMETSEQIKRMADPSFGGQFLAGVRVEQASSIFTNPQRGGDQTALDEITAHLEAGTLAGASLQAAITAERYLVVSARPDASSARWIVRDDGVIRLRGGQPAQPGADLAGSWAVLDTPWGTNSAGWMQSPGRIYIERAEWQGGICRAVDPRAKFSLI